MILISLLENVFQKIKQYRDALLPPLAKAVFNYNKVAEYSWANHLRTPRWSWIFKTAIGKNS